MIREIIEIANEQGYTGMKRVGFYIIAPFVYTAGFVVGFVKYLKEFINKIKKDQG